MYQYLVQVKDKDGDPWQILHGWARPFTYGFTLDDTLDSGKIVLPFSTAEPIVKPFSRVRITINEDGAQVDCIDALCSNAQRTAKARVGVKTYEHTIELVELTKRLEREVCDTMTVTNYLGHNYTQGGQIVYPTVTMNNASAEPYVVSTGKYYRGPVQQGNTVTLYNFANLFNFTMSSGPGTAGPYVKSSAGTVTVTAPDGTVIYNSVPPVDSGATVQLTQDGTYQVQSVLYWYFNDLNNPIAPEVPYTGTATWQIGTFAGRLAAADWTITDVVNRILSAGVTRREGAATTSIITGQKTAHGDPQKYIFDSQQAEQYASVQSPEFFFTRGTMWDALSTVGGFIHAIPRLVDENRPDRKLTLRFDILGASEQYAGTLPPSQFDEKTVLGDEYCGAIDSTAENLLNSTDILQGAVTEPSATGWRAVNTGDGGVAISPADGLEIISNQPFNQSTQVLCLWNNKEYDLTPYVFERAEYDTLSAYGGTYPYAKDYALCYTQGQNNITGLTFVRETTTTGTFDLQYSIVNILQSLGADISTSDDLTQLKFRITYVPYVTTRIVQHKPYLTHPVGNTLIFNQGGNTVECEYYGEHLRGVIARIGNVAWTRTFKFASYADIPKIGQKIGKYYVARVDCSYELLFIKATVVAVENFNKLAEFTGVDSNYRLFDVSEKQSVDRYINYGESCVVSLGSNIEPYSEIDPLVCPRALCAIRASLTNNENASSSVTTPLRTTSMFLQGWSGRDGYDDNGYRLDDLTPLAQNVGLGAGAFANGNSLVFYANLYDNYGAGFQSLLPSTGEGKRARHLLPFGDQLGNISFLHITLSPTATQDAYEYPAAGTEKEWIGASSANDVPGLAYFRTTQSSLVALSEDNPLYISKDSREALKIVIQQHFQADNTRIVFGSAFTNNCLLIKDYENWQTMDGHRGEIYFLPRRLNRLENYIDISGLTPVSAQMDITSYGIGATNPNIFTNFKMGFSITLPAGATNNLGEDAYSWALIDPTNGELYYGVNCGFDNDGNSTPWAAGTRPADDDGGALAFSFVDNAALNEMTMAE